MYRSGQYSFKHHIGRGRVTSGQDWNQHIRQMNQQDIANKVSNV